MKELIVKKTVNSMKLKNLIMSLGSDIKIDNATLEITKLRIDGRQRRFLDQSYIEAVEYNVNRAVIRFTQMVSFHVIKYLLSAESNMTTIKNDYIEADVHINSFEEVCNNNNLYLVDFTLSVCGFITLKGDL
jgi:hypothetical protein